MILRRIIEHVRRQHWTAIVIDFVIVVFGVFMGTQVSNWNAARLDRERARGFMERIDADLAADLAAYGDRKKFWARVREYGAVALHYAETGESGGQNDWEVLLAFFQSSQVAEFYTTNATFEELKSAGELGLIANPELRNSLGQYYSFGDNPALRERPRYREHVRGLMPLDIQSYIWTHCYRSDDASRQEFLECVSPTSSQRANEILKMMRGDPTLASELRYWLSTMEVAMIIARDRAGSATALRDRVESARAQR